MKKTFCFLLILVFCLGLAPVSALAESDPALPAAEAGEEPAAPDADGEAQEVPAGLPVDDAHFPDDTFRAYVREQFDADENGVLSDEEIAAARVIELDITPLTSLQGIEYFPALTDLNAYFAGFFEGDDPSSALSAVDLSHNTRLKNVCVGFCDLTELDVSMLPDLETLFTGYTKLTSLDVSHNPKLTQLICSDSALTSIDLTGCSKLGALDCCGNEGLKTLDLRPCPLLAADYLAGGRMLPEDMSFIPTYDLVRVYGHTGDPGHDYTLAVNTYTTVIAQEPAGLVLNVTSQAELTDALNRAEPVAEIHIAGDFTVTEESLVLFDREHYDHYRDVTVTVEEGVTLTVGNGGTIGVDLPSFWDWSEEQEPKPDEPAGRIVNNGFIVVEKGGDAGFGFDENNGDILIKDGGEFRIPGVNNGGVIVEDGGGFRTAQGGDPVNNGQVVIHEGAEMEARMGSTIHNRGKLTVNGELIVGCVHYDGSDHLWFDSTEAVLGTGRAVICDVGGPEPVSSMDEMAKQMREYLGADSAVTVINATDIPAGLVLNVTSQAELTDALNRTEPVSEIRIAGGFTVTEESLVLFDREHYDHYRDVTVTVEEGVTLTVGNGGTIGVDLPSFWDWSEEQEPRPDEPAGRIVNNGFIVVEKGGDAGFGFDENNGDILIKDGGEFRIPSVNNGGVIVEDGGGFRTAQGGDPVNNGQVVIHEGAEMEARMGSTIHNRGKLTVNGRLIVNCARYPDEFGRESDHLWFESTNPVSGAGTVTLQNADPDNMQVQNFTVLAARMRGLLQNDGIDIRFDGRETDLTEYLEDMEQIGDLTGDELVDEDDVLAVSEAVQSPAAFDAAALLASNYRYAGVRTLQFIVWGR